MTAAGTVPDFDQPVAYVCRLVEWRFNTTPDADTDVADRFIVNTPGFRRRFISCADRRRL